MERGLPQGSPIWPILFLVFVDPLHGIEEKGVIINNINITTLDFAHDLAMIIESNIDMQKNMDMILEYIFF